MPGVTFYGSGFGHGVGMSQYGANGWATGVTGLTLTGEQIRRIYLVVALLPILAIVLGGVVFSRRRR